MLDWPVAELIETDRLTLEPLRVGHAAELAPALDDVALHRYIGGRPASVDQLGSATGGRRWAGPRTAPKAGSTGWSGTARPAPRSAPCRRP